jgi:PAS domain S-box-containing protein
MRNEPDIVKILREEERLRKTQTNASENTRHTHTTKTSSKNSSQDTVLMLGPDEKHITPDANSLQILSDAFFQTSLIAILVLDAKQQIVSWNRYTEILLGMTQEELHLQSISSLHPLDEWQTIASHAHKLITSDYHTETKILTKHHKVLDVAISLNEVKNKVGETLGYLYLINNISAQKQAEHRFHSLVEYTDDLTCLVDQQYRYLLVNSALLSHLGCSHDEVIGKPIKEFYSSSETRDFTSKLDWVFEHGTPLKDVFSRKGKSFLRLFTPIKESSASQPIAVFVVSKDITDTTNVEEMMTEEGKTYQTIFEFFPQLILLTDTKGNIREVNLQIHDWLGYKPDEIREMNYLNAPFFPEESRTTIKRNLSHEMGQPVVSPFEIEILTKQNEKRIGLIHATSLRIRPEQSPSTLIVITDITEQKQVPLTSTLIQRTTTGMAFDEDEKRLQVVLENSLDVIYQLNVKKGTYEYVSPSSVKITGYRADELISLSHQQLEEMVHPEDVERCIQHRQLIIQTPKKNNHIQAIEYRIKHKTLGYRWISDTCTAIFNDRNEPLSIVGTIEDITERKKVWDQLVKSEEKYRILAETSADGVITTDALGRLTYVNPAFEKLCRRRKSQILATPFRNYLLEDSIYFFQQIFIDARKKEEKIDNVELELVSDDGNIIPIEANIAPLKKGDEFSGVMGTIRDITQRREIEDELKKNERLKTEFMNIAAHELRSPVTPIKGYLDLIIHDNDSNDKIKNWAKISLRNAERLLRLVNDILDVSRLDSDTMRFDMEKIDPAELLNEIVEDMRPAITNKKLEFRVNIPKPLPHIIGDKHRLSQVLKNLIGNALKFTDAGYIAVDVEKNDNYLLITVADTGIGISSNELKKIFTKFYQAYTGEDRNNEGTGLGLFISREIIKKHKGTIWAESEVGKGSRFIIQLPYVYKMKVDFKT